MPNRLINETSPYLLQHANNPVDWYPWGQEAFARAKAEDKPVFLSVGYAACHWCHVMAHESFENAEIARQMNESFVCIKVDREERPDVDSIYMQAVQAQTGHGGWPMTVFLTPEGNPFFGGTYFPPEDRHGMPGLPRLLAAMSEVYRSRRAEVIQSSAQLVD
ncbi:MAG: thioredoxin domain-containing protein, partial [Dehalococcoidia bacterium]|nr:thioredoxin domain-containing protein [Dehalococcoidia bacterium]